MSAPWEHGPTVLALGAVWSYWLGVLIKALLVRLQGAASVGLVPQQRRERLLWLFWAPVIGGWMLFPWFTLTQSDAAWQLPYAALNHPLWLSLRWMGAGTSVACLLATIYCWRWMGEHWRVGVITGEKRALITNGPFSLVQHPIYALSILMMFNTWIAVPIWPLLVITLLHCLLINLKARNEEVWMLQMHGDTFLDYQSRSQRFWPRYRPGHAGPTAPKKHPSPR